MYGCGCVAVWLCTDLQRNALVLNTTGHQVVTPFLQEYQLDTTKGGTRDFDADAANAELEKAQVS